ncbi:unnamed protein product [Pseudo-nitzschia multistriata]|uniref:Uncharacterized protein n=1 Tax=Pseudo-nitzschia multistriata TaxID=183589 RepID=A0A448YYH6_9STRA|nr:unnamed protein product [Pseudo-nitzschia multistriata]
MNTRDHSTSSSMPSASGTGQDLEDENLLDISEQVNRPENTPIQQQTINAWHPILDPTWVIVSYFILAAITIPFGYYLQGESAKIVELRQVYDAGSTATAACPSIGENYNANENCTLTFEVPKDMKPPVLVYYELTNFHQNYRKYTTSRDDYQLTGKVGGQSAVDAANCDPINVLGDTRINPCGLIANTFFNDKFTLRDTEGAVDAKGNKLVMREDGIAWESDLKYRFAMPDGYQQKQCGEGKCDSSCCEDFGFSCKEPAISPKDGLCYAYDYPNQNTTQYLYQTYPSVISPLEHVLNEHFVVWMRVAATPNFKKLYGYFEETIPAGTKLEFDVNMNYVVESFKGTKALTMTTNSMWGTKDPTIGITIYSIGYFCLACGLFFGLKHLFKPRKIADRKYLHYKEE